MNDDLITECTCDLIDVSTVSKIQFVRGLSNGCAVHPPSEFELRQRRAAAERDARVTNAQRAARNAP